MPSPVQNGRREAVALVIAGGSTVRDAAAATKVGERTIRSWLADPAFRGRVSELRSELFGRAVGKLADLSGLAADTLRGLLDSDSESVRLGAARTVLEHAPRLRESTELAETVEALKRELQLGGTADGTGGNAPAGGGAAEGGGSGTDPSGPDPGTTDR